jgi:hypothetical protein
LRTANRNLNVWTGFAIAEHISLLNGRILSLMAQ